MGMDDDYSHIIDKLIKYKAEDTIEQIHEYGLDVKAKHLYLVGEDSYVTGSGDGEEPGVEYSMASKFIKNLNILMRISEDPILIHMKTCGGDWQEGMAIYDAIKACPNPITILNYTHARSMSSLIFLAADRRVMMPHSTYMFHGGDMMLEGTLKQFMTEFKEAERTHNVMIDIYVDALKEKGSKSAQSKKAIKKWVKSEMDEKEDVYFTATQAASLGFADFVFGADGKYDWKALISFDEDDE